MNFKYCFLIVMFICSQSYALEQIGDDELGSVTGQNGVYLSGELNMNEDGGPLSLGDAGNSGVWGTCAEKTGATADRCGARIAVELNDTGGWIALDELKGKVSFEGLTIQGREIDAATDNFGGDEVLADGRAVLEIGLPEKLEFENFSYNITTSSQGRPTDSGYTQQVRYGVDFNGTVNVQGKLLVFPVGAP